MKRKMAKKLMLIFFSIIFLLIFILNMAKGFSVFDVEGSDAKYIFIAMIVLIMLVISPLVLIFYSAILRREE